MSILCRAILVASLDHRPLGSLGGDQMDRFLNQKNVERYRTMLENPRDVAQRRIILKLLAEEEAKLREETPEGEV